MHFALGSRRCAASAVAIGLLAALAGCGGSKQAGAADAAAPQIFANGVHAQGTTWYAAGFGGLFISQDSGATWAARGVAEGIAAPARDAWYMP